MEWIVTVYTVDGESLPWSLYSRGTDMASMVEALFTALEAGEIVVTEANGPRHIRVDEISSVGMPSLSAHAVPDEVVVGVSFDDLGPYFVVGDTEGPCAP